MTTGTYNTMKVAGVLTLVLAGTFGVAVAAPTYETTLRLDEALAAGTTLRVENLVGSIRVRGHSEAGVRVEARVLAEAKTEPQARELAEAIRFETSEHDGRRTIHVVYPTERHRQFRVPAVGFGGMVGKWVTPIVRKSTVALEYGGQQIQVGQQRAAAAISVDLTVHVPFDVTASFRQVVGSIDLNAARGDVALEIVEGRIVAEQLFGSLEIASGGGDVVVSRFQGKRLDVHSGAGDIELLEVRTEQAALTTAGGSIAARQFESGPLTLRTGTGDVELSQFESESFSIDSQSGSVVVATKMRGLSRATIASDTGDVVLRIASDRGFDVSANTKSGDITVYRMELETVVEDGKTIARRGRGGPAFDIATPGGKLTVRPDDGSWSARMTSR